MGNPVKLPTTQCGYLKNGFPQGVASCGTCGKTRFDWRGNIDYHERECQTAAIQRRHDMLRNKEFESWALVPQDKS